jgi:molybdopterin synthase sulfur carrier subunit
MESEKSNKIKVVLLSSIAEDLGWNEKFLTIERSQMKVFSVWNLINSNLPQDNIIVSINQEITDMDAMINPDDEVAFMPMFTGG